MDTWDISVLNAGNRDLFKYVQKKKKWLKCGAGEDEAKQNEPN